MLKAVALRQEIEQPVEPPHPDAVMREQAAANGGQAATRDGYGGHLRRVRK